MPRAPAARDTGSNAARDKGVDARRGEHLQLLAAASEHQGIAALHPCHAPALARVAHHELLDEGLGRAAAAAALAHPHHPGAGAAVRQHLGVDQVVHQHHVGFTQHAHRLEGEQLRVAGACADEIDLARVHMEADCEVVLPINNRVAIDMPCTPVGLRFGA